MLHKEDYIRVTRDVVSRLENELNTWKIAIFTILEDRTDSEFHTDESHEELMTACVEYRDTVQALEATREALERMTSEVNK